MIANPYPEFECDQCECIIVLSPRLLTAKSVIRCPRCQNVFGEWENLQRRYSSDKDDDGILRLNKPPLAHTRMLG